MTFRFPARWPEGDPGLNPLSRALERRREAGLPVLDLTVSNPTKCGLRFPGDWTALLGGRAVESYDPDPRGGAAAREAIAAYYGDRQGADAVDPADVFLTAGTSEGYSHLFKLLCAPGDHALIPRPSYPLLETLAELESITLGTYDLVPGATDAETGTPWRLDRAGLEAALTPRTRIVFAVHPGNPTGSPLAADDAAWMLDLADRRGLAVVMDEVFADYALGEKPAPLLRSSGPLVFTLNGLSKLLGLPQLKLAWIHVAGGPEDKEKAKRHLEWICDAYLSVGAPPQAACAGLLRRRAEFQGPIRERLESNRATLREFSAGHAALRPLWPQGGWCVPVRCAGIVEAGMDDEAFATRLLDTEGVHAQPGYFFDFDEEDVIVVSLLPEPEIFREGLKRIVRRLG
jgi:aspartate/methionine/tyrosine aminotransferase